MSEGPEQTEPDITSAVYTWMLCDIKQSAHLSCKTKKKLQETAFDSAGPLHKIGINTI